MPGYSTESRFSLIQLHSEDRKQRAHLKKIAEMQRHTGLDNGAPLRFPQLHQNFLKQLKDKRQEINKENEHKSQKLIKIMTSKMSHERPLYHPSNSTRHNYAMHLSKTNAEYVERIARTKSNYNVQDWRKGYEQHKEYLRIGKDSHLFTPLGIGANQQRPIQSNSLINSKRTTPSASTANLSYKHYKSD